MVLLPHSAIHVVTSADKLRVFSHLVIEGSLAWFCVKFSSLNLLYQGIIKKKKWNIDVESVV